MMPSILIVDDDPILLRMVKLYLADFDAQVELCRSGRAALKKLETARYDIIFTDLQMPEIDGLTLIKKIRLFNQKVPIIILSAYGLEAITREAVKNGANHVLNKPFDSSQLINVINQNISLINLVESDREQNEQNPE